MPVYEPPEDSYCCVHNMYLFIQTACPGFQLIDSQMAPGLKALVRVTILNTEVSLQMNTPWSQGSQVYRRIFQCISKIG